MERVKKKFSSEHGWALAIALAVIGASGSWVTSYYSYKGKIAEQQAVIETAHAEMNSESRGLSFADYLREWDSTSRMVKQLFEDTKFDRFLLLRAWNGTMSPRWATATLQIREEGQRAYTYVHVDLDSDYVDRMREILRVPYAVYITEDMDDSLIRRIYKNEGVTSSVWALIDSETDNDGRTIHTYVSISTHQGVITESEALEASLIVGRLRGMARQYRGIDE